MPKIRVLVVDDSVVIRRMLSDCLAEDPEIEVIGTAPDGKIALDKIPQVNPDIITLDIEMPVMDGLRTLAAIRKTYAKLPVIMFSTLTERGASSTLDALALGASDYVTKPANVGSVSQAMQKIRSELCPKIKGLCQRPKAAATPPMARKPQSSISAVDRFEVLAIGVSTGGPNALAEFLPGLTKDFPLPIVIVQHMPPLFTRLLAERLTAVSGLIVREGQEGAVLERGEAWIAPGGYHMEVKKSDAGVKLHLHEGPRENSCRPAVDVLFRSVAEVFGQRSIAVVLTGMGQDGLRGVESIHELGGRILIQDEATSVVWGMPGAIAHAGLADKILPLPELANEITCCAGLGIARAGSQQGFPAKREPVRAL